MEAVVELDVIHIDSSAEDEVLPAQMIPVVVEPMTTRSDEVAERRSQYEKQMANAYHKWQTLLKAPFDTQWQYIRAINGLVISCWDDDHTRIRLHGVVTGRNSRWRRAMADGNPETRAQWDHWLGATVRQTETIASIVVVDTETRAQTLMPSLFVRALMDVDHKGNQICLCTLEQEHPYLQPAPTHADPGLRFTLGVRLLPVGSTSTDLTLVLLCDLSHCWWRTRMFFSTSAMIDQLVEYVGCIQDIASSDDKWRAVYHAKK